MLPKPLTCFCAASDPSLLAALLRLSDGLSMLCTLYLGHGTLVGGRIDSWRNACGFCGCLGV